MAATPIFSPKIDVSIIIFVADTQLSSLFKNEAGFLILASKTFLAEFFELYNQFVRYNPFLLYNPFVQCNPFAHSTILAEEETVPNLLEQFPMLTESKGKCCEIHYTSATDIVGRYTRYTKQRVLAQTQAIGTIKNLWLLHRAWIQEIITCYDGRIYFRVLRFVIWTLSASSWWLVLFPSAKLFSLSFQPVAQQEENNFSSDDENFTIKKFQTLFIRGSRNTWCLCCSLATTWILLDLC